MKLQAWLVPTLLAFGVPLATHAQSSPGRPLADQVDDGETVYLSPFEVSSDRVNGYRMTETASTRIRRDLLETPTSIQLVTSEFMDDIGAGSILDATQYLSGVSVPILGGVGGIQERQVVRGFSSYGAGLDGFRLRVGGASFDPYLIDRVEIIKGPNPILSPGGTTPGGIGTMTTKSPQFKSANLLRVEVADQYFGDKMVFDSTGAIAGSERFAYRLIGTYRDAKSYVPGRVALKSINPMLTWKISEKSQLKLKGFLSDWKQTGAHAQGNALYIRDDFPYGTGATVSKSDIKPGYEPFGANGRVDWTQRFEKLRRFSAVFTTELTDQLNLRLAVLREATRAQSNDWNGVSIQRASHLRVDPNTGRDTPTLSWALKDPDQPWDAQTNPYESTPIPPGSDITKVELAWDPPGPTYNWIPIMHYQADLSGKFDFGASSGEPLLTLHAVTGTYIKSTDRYSWKSYPGVYEDITDIYDKTQPFLPNAPRPIWIPGPRDANGEGKDLQNKDIQYYIHTQVDTFRKRLILTGGGVYQKRVRENVNYTRNSHSYDSRSKVIPSAAILFRVMSNASVYVAYSQDANAASYYPGGGLPNEDVWQEGEQGEVGIKMDFFNRRLSISVSYFDIEQNNQPVTDPRDIEARRGGTDRIYPQLLNEMTNEGFEFDISGQITPNLSVLGSATKQKKRNQVGFREANTPDTMYNGFIRYGFSSGALDGLSVNLGFNHAGKAAGNNPNVNPTVLGVPHQYMHFLPARTIFNAGASYKWGDVSFQLNIDNLLDEDKPMNSQGRHDMALVPPRNIRLTTTYRF